MKTLILSMLLIPGFVFALEIDEKLTVRIVKSSESKKTLMINRGTEDGLVEGDHAKFIVTAGIVARAVLVKVSPTRSVWSVYRLVNADFINNDAVMTIKISPAVKITKDETQTLVQDDTPTKVSGDPTTLGIPLAEGAQDLSVTDESLSDADLKSLEESRSPVSIVEKNIEILGIINVSALTGATDSGNGKSFSNAQTSHHFELGGEYYARTERDWYSRLSLVGSAALMRLSNQAYNGSASTNDVTEFSLGTNWHPFTLPSVTGDFIPFFHAAFNFGNVKSSYTAGTETITKSDLSSNGSSSGFSLGFGFKFYTYKGLGARVMVDYYSRNEKYTEDELKNTHTKKVSGPRLMLGLSYRF